MRVELTDIARTELAQRAELVLPRLCRRGARGGGHLEFFAARQPAHARGVRAGRGVLAWCDARGLALTAVSPLHGGLHPDPPRVGAHRQAGPPSACGVTTSRPTIRRPRPSTTTSSGPGSTRRRRRSSRASTPRGRRPAATGRTLSRRLVLAMIKRRAAAAGLPPSTCCHTFRATGITAYLSNGGTLEHAQQIAGHASPKTTKLYDRTADTITVDEIERIVI